MSDFIEGEFTEHTEEGMPEQIGLIIDKWGKVKWRTKDGQIMLVSEMTDSHLRNTALFLMGMGYTTCIAREDRRVIFLTALRIEWERRMLERNRQKVTHTRTWKVDQVELERWSK